jgi:hypothetical protein
MKSIINKKHRKHIMKVQNVKIVPHVLKQAMKSMECLDLNKIEKDIVDVEIV